MPCTRHVRLSSSDIMDARLEVAASNRAQKPNQPIRPIEPPVRRAPSTLGYSLGDWECRPSDPLPASGQSRAGLPAADLGGTSLTLGHGGVLALNTASPIIPLVGRRPYDKSNCGSLPMPVRRHETTSGRLIELRKVPVPLALSRGQLSASRARPRDCPNNPWTILL